LFFGNERRTHNIQGVFDKIDKLLGSVAAGDVTQLMSIWRARDVEEWSRSPEIYRALGERILHKGEPLFAFDVVTEGLAILPGDPRLRHLQVLALARSGATERANAMLEEIRREGQAGEETLGMLGRTYKDLAANAVSTTERERFLRRAAETYLGAYELTGGYWTGINAATMQLIIGEKGRACEIASKVRDACLKEIQDTSGDQYWELAALGEAGLICRDLAQAEEWYARAAEEGKDRFGDWQSSRRNARLILHYWGEDLGWIDKFLRVPSVIVFAGHMIDRPDRPSPRFPAELEAAVEKEIRNKIERLKPGFGFASAACGSDILFLEAMLDRGVEVTVALPYETGQFIRDSVDFVPNSNWRARFERVLERAARVIMVSTQKLEIGGVSYEFSNQMLLGLAAIRARQLDTALVPLAVWDGKSGDGPGGAASVIENWRTLGYEPEIVDPAKISAAKTVAALSGRRAQGRAIFKSSRRLETAASCFQPRTPSGPQQQFGSRMVAVLFADAVGFSKLSEQEVPLFVQHFLGAIARLSEQFGETIIAKNTWGDGLYFVFSDVDVAGQFALKLAHLVGWTKWEEKGLREGLNLRIALHAGPVYEFDDPITGRRSHSGTHVSRAARLEPITPPGEVYASEAFAALAAARRVTAFGCDYIGQTPMAKGYGTLPTYHVRRSATAAPR
jgi:class 3 adenylate cyclase